MAVRLSKVAREFNVGLSTIVDFLQEKGIKISSDPNAKLTDDQYSLIAKEFSTDSEAKKESNRVDLKNTRLKKETVSIDNMGNTESHQTEFISVKDEIKLESKIKVVDHIDLNKLNKPKNEEKVEEKPVEKKEEKRFAKQSAKHDALVAKGKNVDWKVVPKKIIDLNEQIENLLAIIDRLDEKYQEDIATSSNIDFFAKSIDLIDYFKAKASQVVYKVTKAMAKEKAIKLMEEVGIPEARIRYRQYPFEFSGGMRQRIVIAIALSANPDILICDEPTTALDVTIQSQILELINNLKKERNLSVIYITHDLGVVAKVADYVAVMYAGQIVEVGKVDEIFYDARHPYTWALLSALPQLGVKGEALPTIDGTPPNLFNKIKGDAFAPRNRQALAIDFEEEPPYFEVSETHKAKTWYLDPRAPKIEPPKSVQQLRQKMRAHK